MNRAQIEMHARDDAEAYLRAAGIPLKTGQAEAWIGGFKAARVQVLTRDHDITGLRSMRDAATAGSRHVIDKINAARLQGRAVALDEELQHRNWEAWDAARGKSGRGGIYTPAAPKHFKDDFDKVQDALKPHVIHTKDGQALIGGTAPKELVDLHSSLRQRGYANGYFRADPIELEFRADDSDDDSDDDDEPQGPHKFKGTNLMKCKDCGFSINAKVHKQSWPANRK